MEFPPWAKHSQGFCPTAALTCIRPGGGRTWWAHFEFTRMNITPTILCEKIEEMLEIL
jgi:hypothetical protein